MTKPHHSKPAYAGLAAFLAEQRDDWDPDQILAELIGCPWSNRLVLDALHSAWSDDTRLRVAEIHIRMPSQRRIVTPEQQAAYTAHMRRLLNRNRGDDTP
ncbi:hypothetical protein ACWEN6_13715 [Sphaerisporangium sp. NPDC004334]